VVFDLDDTLYLERNYVRSGFRAVGRFLEKEFSQDGFFSVAWEEFEMGRRGDIFDRALERLDGPPVDCPIQELVTVYRRHVPELSLESDARACLDDLDGKVTLALVTDGPLASQKSKAKALKLVRWIEHLVFTADLSPGLGKPHPRAFELVQERAGFEGEACIYVADNPLKDFFGPQRLGWKTLRIRRPGGLHSHENSDSQVDSESTRLLAQDILRRC